MPRQAPLGPLLDQLLGRLGLETAIAEQKAVVLWPQIVGAINARHCWAERVRDGVLLVAASSHTWAQELSMLKRQMLERLNDALGKPVIRDIHFRAGRKRPVEEVAPAVPGAPEATEADRVEAATISARSHDAELRPHLERAIVGWRRSRRWWQALGWRRCAKCGMLHHRSERYCRPCQDLVRRRRRRKEISES